MKEQSMGQMVRRIRVEQGMTQEVLADGICTTSYLSRVEHGSQIPSREIYQLLMERLGEWLFLCFLEESTETRTEMP